MYIESLELKNFRNYEELSIVLDPGTNILYGDNAQGKTNVLEAVYLCGTTKSHRGSKDKEMIRFEQDESHMQIDGAIDEVCSPYPIDKKFEAFNFHVINIDGNDFDQIDAAFKEAKATKGMPTAIIAHTVKGKGVSFMENQVGWHGTAPNDEQYAVAMEELEKAGEALCQK